MPRALAQSCPAPLADARRLVLVTAKTMNDMPAAMQLYERASPTEPWRATGPSEPVVLGRAGMGWSHFFRRYARAGEPIKVEGDKRAPAGIYPIGRSFGTVPSSRPGHIQVTDDTVCVYEPASPRYNTITSRKLAGPSQRREHEPGAADVPARPRGRLSDRRPGAGRLLHLHPCLAHAHDRNRGLRRDARAAGRGIAGFSSPAARCSRSCRSRRSDALPAACPSWRPSRGSKRPPAEFS